jgi:DNA-binding XRE family transcriptional regulator
MKSTNRLRVVRAEQRLTQGQVATKTRDRLTQTRISLIENGVEPTDEEKRVIAKALRLPIEVVFPTETA